MSDFGCRCKDNCTAFIVIAGIIIGVVTAFLRITAAITVTPAFLWVLLGIAIGYLAVLLIASSLTAREVRGCICPIISTLILGILGTVLTSVILLGITFVATSIVGAIITGLLLLFFTLVVGETACLVKCILRCDD